MASVLMVSKLIEDRYSQKMHLTAKVPSIFFMELRTAFVVAQAWPSMERPAYSSELAAFACPNFAPSCFQESASFGFQAIPSAETLFLPRSFAFRSLSRSFQAFVLATLFQPLLALQKAL